jgi:hypothetical protein
MLSPKVTLPIRAAQFSLAEVLERIPLFPVSLDVKEGQLVDTHVLANWLGLYDAADYIRDLRVMIVRSAEHRLDLDACHPYIGQLPQRQDSTTAQALDLATACDVFGLFCAAEHLREVFGQENNRLATSA